MTVLEMMIVLAIIGGGVVLVRTGFRQITKADLVESSTELSAMLKRTAQLAIEKGEMHRVMFDVDQQLYAVEVCQGATTIHLNEKVRGDAEKEQEALKRGQERLRGVPMEAIAQDAETATKHAMAIAGHHVADRMCVPVNEKEVSGMTSGVDEKTKDADGKTIRKVRGDKDSRTNMTWVRSLRPGIKFKSIWVQHKDEATTKGQVAIYFWPTGSSEKAVVEVTDDSETFTVLVHGLTGRIQLQDGALENVDEHMMRNVMGDKDAERDAEGARE
jgi:type II secretory pathway pseudopilin PulG